MPQDGVLRGEIGRFGAPLPNNICPSPWRFQSLMTTLRREHDSIRDEFGLEAKPWCFTTAVRVERPPAA
jgi:hypothetical protein